LESSDKKEKKEEMKNTSVVLSINILL